MNQLKKGTFKSALTKLWPERVSHAHITIRTTNIFTAPSRSRNMANNLITYRFSNKLKVKFIMIFIVILIFLAPGISLASDARLNYVKKQLVSSGLDTTSVNKLVADSRLKLYPIKIVVYKQPNWKSVEKKLYSQSSVQAGINYIQANQDVFNKAQLNFGVKKEVLVGIINIETDFGKNSGNYSVFNMLYSRMEEWPQSKWKNQANELVALAKYCLKSQLDCFNIKGSYAGAFGIVQFMPSSLLAYGVDGNNDGIVNLSTPEDAIPSAANFLKAHNWQKNQLKALASYYGSSVGYPKIVLAYASLLSK